MGAQYKDYAHSDNARVLKAVIGPPQKAPVVDTPFEKDVVAIGKSVAGGVGNKLSQLQGVKNAISAGVTDKVNRVKRYFDGTTDLDIKKEKEGLDRAVFSNTFRPSNLAGNKPTANPVVGTPRQSGFVPNPDAQFERLGAGPRPGAQLGPGLTITQNRFGEVGLFGSNGQRVSPSQTRLSGGNLGGTPLPAGQQTTFNRISVPMPGGTAAPSSGAPARPGAAGFTGVTDYSNLFAQDAKIGAMRLANAKNDYRIGAGNPMAFTGPGEPGPGTYGNNSMMSELKNRRDMLVAQMDDYNRKNPLTASSSVSDHIAAAANRSALFGEIKHIDEQIFGRTDLANKIMTALIGKDATLGAQTLENKGKVDVQALENQGTYDVRRMMETEEGRRHLQTIFAGLGGKGDKKSDKGQDAYYDFIKGGLGKGLESRLANGESLDVILNDMLPLARKNLGVGTNPLDIIE